MIYYIWSFPTFPISKDLVHHPIDSQPFNSMNGHQVPNAHFISLTVTIPTIGGFNWVILRWTMLIFRGVYHYPSLKRTAKKPKKSMVGRWISLHFLCFSLAAKHQVPLPKAPELESRSVAAQRPFRPRQETNRVANSYPRNLSNSYPQKRWF